MLFCSRDATSLVVAATSRSASAAVSSRSAKTVGAGVCSFAGEINCPNRRGTAPGKIQKIPAASSTSRNPATLREASMAKKP